MPQLKPFAPVWQPGKAPAGCKLYLPISQQGYGGTKLFDLYGGHAGNPNNGLLVGAPVWQQGLYGPQLGGISTSNYVTIDPAVSVFKSYPFWITAMFATTSAAGGTKCLVDSSSTGSAVETVLYLNAAWVPVFYVSAVSPATGPTALNDGLPHVVTGVCYSGTRQSLFVDGAVAATATNTAGNLATLLYATIGAQRTPTLASSFSGSIIAVALGNGLVPDVAAHHADWLSGRFAAVRSKRSMVFLGAPPPPVSGTGAATFGHVTASGVWAVTDAGTGAPVLGRESATGSGVVTDSGTGAPVLGRESASGSGIVTVSGTGSPALGRESASGLGIVTDAGTGAATFSLVTVSGTGKLIPPPPVSPSYAAIRRRRRAAWVQPPPTLYDALRARLLSGEPRLTDCYRRQPHDKAFVYPYAIYNDLNESPEWVSGVNVYPSWVAVQVTVVSPDDLEAEDLRDSCYLLFTQKRNPDGSAANPPLVFGDGGMPPFGSLPGLKTQFRSPGRSSEGRPLWQFSFAIQFFITRGM